MRTLRGRLLSGTVVGTAVVWSIAGVVLDGLARSSLWAEFDESLGGKARVLAALAEQEEGGVELEFDRGNLPEFRPSVHAEYYEVWGPDDTVVARSASLNRCDLERIGGPIDKPAYRSVVLPDGRPGRLAGITFGPRGGDDVRGGQPPLEITLVVGRATVGRDRTLARLRLLLIGVCAAAVLICVGVLSWFVGRGLEPVDQLAVQIARVGEADLAARIAPAGIPAELMPIVDRLNDLLARLERTFLREKTFTADVAHELRTPLAGLRSTLEVCLARQREPEEYRRAASGCLEVAGQMQWMVENLLSLARADARQLTVTRERIDVGALLEECWGPLAPRAAQRGLHVEWRRPEACHLETDRGLLRLVLHNVLDNAVTYTDTGGRIAIECHVTNGRVELRVSNTGSEIPQEQVESVFDRFWRGDSSRWASGQHCGLGLSLCQKLITLLGGTVSATSAAGGMFVISIVLDNP